MSYELQTRLDAILGFSPFLNNQFDVNSQQKQYLEIISNSGDYLLSLIKDSLDSTKIEITETCLTQESSPI